MPPVRTLPAAGLLRNYKAVKIAEAVTSTKIKLDGVERSHRATAVHISEQGTWLFSPAGTVINVSNSPVAIQPADGVQFFPANTLATSGGWYVAWCWGGSGQPAGEALVSTMDLRGYRRTR